MDFSVSKLKTVEECDAVTALIDQLTESLAVSESVDRLASKRISQKAEQTTVELEKVKAELASCEAQLAVVTDTEKRNELMHEKMVNEAKKFGLELRVGQSGISALLLKEVEIATLVSEQEHYDTLIAAIATRKAEL